MESESPFFELESKGWSVAARSLVAFEAIPFKFTHKVDWIFFYSKNAIDFFFKSEAYSTKINYGVFGEGSSKAFFRITGKVPHFIGNGTARQTAEFINEALESSSILFIKAKNSLSSVENLIDNKIEFSSIEVYDNRLILDIQIPKTDIVVFTSPFNVKAWLLKHTIENVTLFAIGSTTAKTIFEKTGVQVSYCEQPSLGNLFKLVEDYINENY